MAGGEPELAVPALDGDMIPPIGCACFNDAEVEILWAASPESKYRDYLAQLEALARNDCDTVVPPGWDHNCYDEGPDGPTFKDPYAGGAGSCVGDCSYTNPGAAGCGDEPNPYECEEMYGGGETGDGETDGVGQQPREWKL